MCQVKFLIRLRGFAGSSEPSVSGGGGGGGGGGVVGVCGGCGGEHLSEGTFSYAHRIPCSFAWRSV